MVVLAVLLSAIEPKKYPKTHPSHSVFANGGRENCLDPYVGVVKRQLNIHHNIKIMKIKKKGLKHYKNLGIY